MSKIETIKHYARRDSATTVLRKLGIHSRDYDAFIVVQEDGTFACHVTAAENHLMSLQKLATKAKAKPASKTATKTSREGISSFARQMISDGSTNQEVWAALVEKFNLDDSKRHYPTWYRCEMKRTGLLPRD